MGTKMKSAMEELVLFTATTLRSQYPDGMGKELFDDHISAAEEEQIKESGPSDEVKNQENLAGDPEGHKNPARGDETPAKPASSIE